MPSSKLASSLVEQTPQTACLQLPVLFSFRRLVQAYHPFWGASAFGSCFSVAWFELIHLRLIPRPMVYPQRHWDSPLDSQLLDQVHLQRECLLSPLRRYWAVLQQHWEPVFQQCWEQLPGVIMVGWAIAHQSLSVSLRSLCIKQCSQLLLWQDHSLFRSTCHPARESVINHRQRWDGWLHRLLWVVYLSLLKADIFTVDV